MSSTELQSKTGDLNKELTQLSDEKSSLENQIKVAQKNIQNLSKSDPNYETKVKDEEAKIAQAKAEIKDKDYARKIATITDEMAKIKTSMRREFPTSFQSGNQIFFPFYRRTTFHLPSEHLHGPNHLQHGQRR